MGELDCWSHRVFCGRGSTHQGGFGCTLASKNQRQFMADWKSLYPFESQYLEIPKSETSADRIRMHYVEQGGAGPSVPVSPTVDSGDALVGSAQPSAGEVPTVLCVHGNPTWSFTYREILKQCSDQAQYIAVDHIGCGLSDKPQKYNYSLEQHVGNLRPIHRATRSARPYAGPA